MFLLRMVRSWVVIGILLLVGACGLAPAPPAEPATSALEETEQQAAPEVVITTVTPLPNQPPAPTSSPVPTTTPLATATPIPAPTAPPAPTDDPSGEAAGTDPQRPANSPETTPEGYPQPASSDPALPPKPPASDPALPPKPTQPAPTEPPAQPGSTIGSEVLFLRNQVLIAYDVDSQRERTLADNVLEFAATPTGDRLALVRTVGGTVDVWTLRRDGSALQQQTRDARYEGDLSWAPGGVTLAYASGTVQRPSIPTWASWSAWCRSSEVRLYDVPLAESRTLEAGCNPAFSGDGRRLAFATPPQEKPFTTEEPIGAVNAVRLVNRQGENGWNFARAEESTAHEGYLVYAPAWSPDSQEVAYHRFLGYRALVDVAYTEMGGSFQGNGVLLSQGAGWLKPARFSLDGTYMVVVQYNYSDARGFTGYELWEAQVLEPGQPGETMTVEGTLPTDAVEIDTLNRATAAAWSPRRQALAVVLPAGWGSFAMQEPNAPLFQNTEMGDLWLWEPGGPTMYPLVEGVDYGSSVLWLPGV